MSDTLKKISYSVLGLYSFYCICLICWTVFYSGSTDGDTIEHIHTSWLIHTGKIPYKDFFQHHHPLIWYLGAPLVGFFEYSVKAVDAVDLLTIAITTITMVYIYRIHKSFLGGTLGGLIAVSFFVLPHISLFNKDFKPDNYMTLGLVAGIYYLFCYLKDKGLFNLSVSFLSFFTAFMFTQKSALELFGIGLIILYLIIIKKIELKDCLLSAILPIMLYIVFLAYLHSHDVLLMYFRANFELNAHIPDVFFTRRFIYPSYELIVAIIISLYGCFRYLYGANVYVKFTGLCFMLEFIIRLYYFTPFVYYYAFMQAITSIFAGYILKLMLDNKPKLIYFVMAYFIILGALYTKYYSRRIAAGDDYKYGASGYVLKHITPCDYVLNGYRIGYNMFGRDIVYIWNLLGQIDVIADTIKLHPLADLETLIRKYRPKIIFGGTYYDTYREYRGAIGVYPIHKISKNLLDELYRPLHRDGLYILKPNYQSYNCKYNERTKTYEYVDKKF